MKMAVPGKQYGLILLKKSGTKSTTVARPSVFEEDSDDEISVGESLQKEAAKKKSMKQTHLEMQKALEQDSSVYEYDSVYDDIHKKDERSKPLAHSDNRKPKYISQLLHAVEERKKEQERREERKIQKERETEGEQFKDKEAFVTSAYRQKLLERQAEAEAQRKEAALEAALDVKKQKDLSGFYRHLLSQTVGEDREPAADATPTSQRPSPCGPAHSQSDGKAKQDRRPEACSSSHSKRQYRDRSPSCESSSHSNRQYRDRSPSCERSSHSNRQYRDRSPSCERSSHSKRQYRDRSPSCETDEAKELRRYRGRTEKEKQKSGHQSGKDEKEWRTKERGEDRDRRMWKNEETHGQKLSRDERYRDRERDNDRERKRGGEKDGERNREREERKEGDRQKDRVNDEKQGKEEIKDNSVSQPGKFAKRSSDQTVSSARERFLARQMARSSSAKTYIEKEED